MTLIGTKYGPVPCIDVGNGSGSGVWLGIGMDLTAANVQIGYSVGSLSGASTE